MVVDPADVDTSTLMVIAWYGGRGVADEKSKLTMRSLLAVPAGIGVAMVNGAAIMANRHHGQTKVRAVFFIGDPVPRSV